MSRQINDRMLWPKGKRKAFTLSYDDGITQDIRFIKMLNQRGIKATFNLNSGLFGQEELVSAGKEEVTHNKLSQEEVLSVYRDHEIAGHGKYHVCMTGMDSGRCIAEILEDRKTLEGITCKPVTGFAYAFGAFDSEVMKAVKACGMTYARTIAGSHKFDIPQDFFAWNPTCHHDDEQLFELTDEFLSDKFYFSLVTPAKLFYVWGHSYEFDQCDNWDHIESFLDRVGGHEEVWYASNGEIQAYVEAFRRLVFTADGKYVYNPSAIPVYLGGMFTNRFIELPPGQLQALIEPINM